MWELYVRSSYQQPSGEQTAKCPAQLGASVKKYVFYTFRISPQEASDEEKSAGERREADSLAMQGAAEPCRRGWARWASPAEPCDWAQQTMCVMHPAGQAGSAPWAPSPVLDYSVNCNVYVDGHYLLSKFWDPRHGPLPTIKPNWGALLGLLVKMLAEGWTTFFFNVLDCFPSLFWTTE